METGVHATGESGWTEGQVQLRQRWKSAARAKGCAGAGQSSAAEVQVVKSGEDGQRVQWRSWAGRRATGGAGQMAGAAAGRLSSAAKQADQEGRGR